MKPGWIVGRLKPKYLISLLILVLAVVAAILIYKHYHKNVITPISGNPLPNSQLTQIESNQAAQMLAQKNYQQAEASYISAATAASSSGDNQKAISLLQEGIAKIPDQDVSWQLYDTLAGLAKLTNNRSLEISSLQKALAKAQQPNSGCPPATIVAYQNVLKQLGAP